MKTKAWSGIMLTLLLVSMLTLAFNIRTVNSDPTTWTVDDDGPAHFSSIQEAIDSSLVEDGDTIFVHNGTYYENVIVKKAVMIIGENVNSTIVDGNITRGSVIYVTADNVTISGFTITRKYSSAIFDCGIALNSSDNNISYNIIENSTEGIWVNYEIFWVNGPSYNNISYNIVTNTHYGIVAAFSSDNNIGHNNITTLSEGIWLSGSTNNTVNGNNVYSYNGHGYGIIANVSDNNILTGNTISNNMFGIGLSSVCSNNVISGNDISNNDYGIEFFFSCNNNVISRNNVSNNDYGISLYWSSNNTISGNNITANNYDGVFIWESSNNSIYGNNITNNDYGIRLDSSSNNSIYHNNFIDNAQQAHVETTPTGSANFWDHEYPFGGNYWSEYADVDLYSGPGQDFPGSDGIWDHPYTIDDNNKDKYPLSNRWSSTTILNTNVTKGGETYTIQVVSNATVIDFSETPGSIKLTVSGESGTSGYVKIIQPVGLNSTNIKVFLNKTKLTFPSEDPPRSISTNGTHYFIYFTFTFNSSYELTIAFPIEGDLDYDGAVDNSDCVTLAIAYGSILLDTSWNPHSDLNEDNIIDVFDLRIIAVNYGKTWVP